MGMCLPCFGGAADDVAVTPDPDTRRRQLAEAAEKRQKEVDISCGLTKKKKKMELAIMTIITFGGKSLRTPSHLWHHAVGFCCGRDWCTSQNR
uniref:Small VCP/p97-interacting protein n=1 Tax=Neogobius melanostomus TaxID=47308 RepID=A0A8C6UPM4_9GOBI